VSTAPKRSNRQLPEGEAATSQFTFRCHPKDKARWVKAAKGGKLAQWVNETLNREARKKRHSD